MRRGREGSLVSTGEAAGEVDEIEVDERSREEGRISSWEEGGGEGGGGGA